ncbi:SRPBCC family protein [Rhodococcus chondri]|uniref:SRPBCC family protein n=1 Tax=Rhodococcus chondri TaxID=3065941 RepID=A0ABU7JZR7_9NOCA|nr:SRPBCC family protein [Rhodococcus sp. CC-R104]MEE2035511.1 SRPBCC family protein [Rhodococcus sp. CC-R104]
MKDARTQIDAVRRTVGRRALDTGEASVVTISRSYPTTVDDLWDACTDPERIPRWFLPVTGELRVGGRYQLEGNAGGEILTCDPPHSFTATWEFAGATSWIEVGIAADAHGGARLELAHIAHADGDFWEQYGPGAVGIGWEGGFLGLALYLESGSAVDPAEFQQWATSPEGVRFHTASGNGWYDADVASGTDAEQARARADRTIAFYTGT